MIFFYSLCGVGVVAAGLVIGELFGRKSRRPGGSVKRIEVHKDTNVAQAVYFGGEYLPPPGDDRPPH